MLRPLVLTTLTVLSLTACGRGAVVMPGILQSQAALPPGYTPNPCIGTSALIPPDQLPTKPSRPCGCKQNVGAQAFIPPDHLPQKPGC